MERVTGHTKDGRVPLLSSWYTSPSSRQFCLDCIRQLLVRRGYDDQKRPSREDSGLYLWLVHHPGDRTACYIRAHSGAWKGEQSLVPCGHSGFVRLEKTSSFTGTCTLVLQCVAHDPFRVAQNVYSPNCLLHIYLNKTYEILSFWENNSVEGIGKAWVRSNWLQSTESSEELGWKPFGLWGAKRIHEIFCPCIRSHCRDVMKHLVGVALCDLFEYGCVYVLVNEALIWSSYCLFTFTVVLASYSWTPRERADDMWSHGRVKAESVCCVQLEQWPGSGEARSRTAAFIWGGVTDWRADQWAWQGWTRTTTGQFWIITQHKQKFSFTINMTNRNLLITLLSGANFTTVFCGTRLWKQNTRGNISKLSVSLACYWQMGSKFTNHSPIAWRREG